MVPGITTFSQSSALTRGHWQYLASPWELYDTALAPPRPIRSMVVSLGTQADYGFRRLLDRLVPIVPPGTEVLWQTGGTDTTGLGIDARERVPSDEMSARIRAADVVVAHAGTVALQDLLVDDEGTHRGSVVLGSQHVPHRAVAQERLIGDRLERAEEALPVPVRPAGTLRQLSTLPLEAGIVTLDALTIAERGELLLGLAFDEGHHPQVRRTGRILDDLRHGGEHRLPVHLTVVGPVDLVAVAGHGSQCRIPARPTRRRPQAPRSVVAREAGEMGTMGTVLVTGTSSGIGLATAVRLARAGFDVVAGMRDPAAGAPRLAEAAGEATSAITVVALDVDSDASVEAAFSQLPALDALVNNAGIGPNGVIEELPLADWKATFETNLFGVVRCVQAALPHMRERGRGAIVNVGSFGARFPISPISPYLSSKAALAMLSEVLALEVRPFGVRVVLLDVGYTSTALGAKARPIDRSSPYREVATKGALVLGAGFARAMAPETVADAICEAIVDADHPFRRTVGSTATDALAVRDSFSDDEWIELFNQDRSAFVGAYREASGIDVSPPRPGG